MSVGADSFVAAQGVQVVSHDRGVAAAQFPLRRVRLSASPGTQYLGLYNQPRTVITTGTTLGVRPGAPARTKLLTADRRRLGGIRSTGRPAILNAGSLVARKTLAEADDEFWAKVMSLNVGSLRRVTRAAAPHLIAAAKTGGGASIVNLSSLAGRKGGHGGSLAYSTAKGAVLTFTRSLASELGPHGVRVNALAPGLILGTSFHDTHTTPEAARATVAGIPLGRGGRAADIARAAVFLASEYDGFITGATLDINGGVYGC